VRCEACGEGVNYEREVRVGGRTLCRGCAGEHYYTVPAGEPTAHMTGVIPTASAIGHDEPVAHLRAR
jgi:hypothetical protein